MDARAKNPSLIEERARAEKIAKIVARTIVLSEDKAGSFGQNAYFYDAAEGLISSVILLVSEFCPDGERHILSVYKIIHSRRC